jgi:hypothetical protein
MEVSLGKTFLKEGFSSSPSPRTFKITELRIVEEQHQFRRTLQSLSKDVGQPDLQKRSSAVPAL